MANFRVYVTIDVDSKKGDAAIKGVKSKLDKIPGKKKIQFESNAPGLMGSLRDLTVVLGGVTRGYRMAKRVITEVIAAQEKQVENEAKVRQAIESTNHAAGFQADQLIKLAAAWQRQYNIADEVILAAQTKLLSFANIAGDQFTRTLMASADIAVVMNQDVNAMTETVVQLGKALNDPLTGLTLLNRSGITFSEQQKEQIKYLAQNNQLLEAQGIILTELERQYGGQAKAIADLETGPMKAYRLALGDLKERMGAVGTSIMYDLVMNLKPLIEGIDETDIKIGLLVGVAIGLIATVHKLRSAITALGLALHVSTGWIGAAVTILGTLTAALILFTKSQRQANAERRESVKNLIEQNKHLLKQAGRYKTLRDQEALTTTEEEELRSIRDELLEQHPELVRGTENYERALNGLKLKIESLNDEQLMLSFFEERQELKDFQKDFEKAKKQYVWFNEELERVIKSTNDVNSTINYGVILEPDNVDKTVQKINDIFKNIKFDALSDKNIKAFTAGHAEGFLIEISKINNDLADIQRGRKEASKGEISDLEEQLKYFQRAHSAVSNIKKAIDGVKDTEQAIDDIRLSQILNRGLLNEKEKEGLTTEEITAYYEKYKFQDLQYHEWKKQQIQAEINDMKVSNEEKEALLQTHLTNLEESRNAYMNKEVKETLSPEDLAKYYEELKFIDNEYFLWKKDRIKEDVEALEISADQKRNLTNKLIDDLIAEYFRFYNMDVSNFEVKLEVEPADPNNLKEVEDDINADIEKLDIKPIEVVVNPSKNIDRNIASMRSFSNAIEGAMGNITSISKLSELSFSNIAQAIDQMLADILKSLLSRALIFALFSLIPGIGGLGKFGDFVFGSLKGEAEGTDRITEKDITRVPGADLGKEDGIIAIQKEEAVVNTEGTQHEFNRAMINLMNQGIDISDLISQFETGTKLPAPNIKLDTTRFNDENIVKSLRLIVNEIKNLDEHFVEKETLDIKEIKEVKEVKEGDTYKIENIDAGKAVEKLAELGGVLKHIVDVGTGATSQDTEKATEMVLNIKKEFVDSGPEERQYQEKTDLSEFNRAFTESMNQGIDLQELITQMEHGYVLPLPDVSVQAGINFNDQNIVNALVDVIKEIGGLSENIAKQKLDVQITNKINEETGEPEKVRFDDKNTVKVLDKVIDKLSILNDNLVSKDMSNTVIIYPSSEDPQKQVRVHDKTKAKMTKAGYDVDSRL